MSSCKIVGKLNIHGHKPGETVEIEDGPRLNRLIKAGHVEVIAGSDSDTEESIEGSDESIREEGDDNDGEAGLA